MKKLRVRGKYASPLINALEKAGYEFSHHAQGSHIVFAAPSRPNIFIPSELDHKGAATKIARAAGVALHA